MQSWLRYVRLPFVSPSLSDISPLFWYVQFEKREAVYSIFLFRSFGSHALFSLTRITFQFPLSNHSLTTRKKGKEATSLAEIFALSSPRPSLSPKSAHITFGNKARIGIKDSFLKTRWDLGFEKEKKLNQDTQGNKSSARNFYFKGLSRPLKSSPDCPLKLGLKKLAEWLGPRDSRDWRSTFRISVCVWRLHDEVKGKEGKRRILKERSVIRNSGVFDSRARRDKWALH